jgi:polyphenol oxidase
VPVPLLPQGVESARERRLEGVRPSLHAHPGWAAAMPWLVHGVTDGTDDMSLFGGTPAGQVLPRWQQLRDALGCAVIVHARQVHQARVLAHGAIPPGVHIAENADGHATDRPGTLLAVSVADCVPIYVIAPEQRAVALLHGGWRGVAAGILEHGVAMLKASYGADPHRLRVHFGPAICGACFEVGPEVVSGLGLDEGNPGQGAAGYRRHVDLRAALAQRAVAAGVRTERVSTSAFCTRCGQSPFYSHRGGCAERQVAVLGIRPAPP